LPLPATPIYHVDISNPREELPRLRDRYPDAGRALVRYQLRYRAGSDNLEEILSELDRIFPRWYQREWQEAGALGEAVAGPAVSAHESFRDTVLAYLETQLAGHDDHDALIQHAEALLAEET